MQPTAQAVGLLPRRESPKGAKDSASYICQHPFAYSFQHTRPASSYQARVPPRSVRLPRRHYPRNARNRTDRQRHRGSRSCASTYPACPFCCGDRSCDQDELVRLGPSEMELELCLANQIWSFQRQRIECRGGDKIYCRSGRTSQKASLSRRVFGVPEKEQRGVRREIPLRLVSVAPSGLSALVRPYPRLAPWAAFLRRFAADFTKILTFLGLFLWSFEAFVFDCPRLRVAFLRRFAGG